MNHSMNETQPTPLGLDAESLLQQQELLLYTVTHDLRTPVMTILGFADLLLADWQNNADPAQSHQYIERIRNAAHRQSQVIQDLQRLVQTQQQTLQPEQVNLSKLVHDQLSTHATSLPEITMKVADDHYASCDRELTKNALTALLINALKLARSSQAPMIEFGKDSYNGNPCFFVTNNGTGFDLGLNQSLLALFRCLQSGSELAGTGIALLTATMIIHRHGGRLWAKTQANRGATIYFCLPE